jgi:hypothetical protein
VFRRGRRFSLASQSALLGLLFWADIWLWLQLLQVDALRTQPLLFLLRMLNVFRHLRVEKRLKKDKSLLSCVQT